MAGGRKAGGGRGGGGGGGRDRLIPSRIAWRIFSTLDTSSSCRHIDTRYCNLSLLMVDSLVIDTWRLVRGNGNNEKFHFSVFLVRASSVLLSPKLASKLQWPKSTNLDNLSWFIYLTTSAFTLKIKFAVRRTGLSLSSFLSNIVAYGGS